MTVVLVFGRMFCSWRGTGLRRAVPALVQGRTYASTNMKENVKTKTLYMCICMLCRIVHTLRREPPSLLPSGGKQVADSYPSGHRLVIYFPQIENLP